MGLESFVGVVAVASVGPALIVRTSSWSGGYVHQSLVLLQNSFRLGVLSAELGVRTLVGMTGLPVWGMLVLALGLSAGVLPSAAAWSHPP